MSARKKKDALKFCWPETGTLTVQIRGNDSATLRFTPSKAAIQEGLHKASPGAAYDDFRAYSGLAITGEDDRITETGVLVAGCPSLMTGGRDMSMEDLGGYEKYAAQYNQHLQRGELGGCGEDLFLMATCLREEGKRVDELKALMLSFYFDLNGVGSGPTVNRNTTKRAAEAVKAADLDHCQAEQLYIDTIHKDTVPRPIMSVRDSLCIFEMCMEGRCDEAEDVLNRFIEK